MKLINEDCFNEAIYGKNDINTYFKKAKEIGIKNLGDLKRFKRDIKSEINKDTDSDIEQINTYRDLLGKDFKIRDEEQPNRKAVGEEFDLDEALGLKENFEPFFFKGEDGDYFRDEANYYIDTLDVTDYIDTYDSFRDFVDNEFSVKVLGAWGNSQEMEELFRYFVEQSPKQTKIGRRIWNDSTVMM